MAFSLRNRSKINYRLLHEGEPLPKPFSLPISCDVLPDFYTVERLIWRRKGKIHEVSLLF